MYIVYTQLNRYGRNKFPVHMTESEEVAHELSKLLKRDYAVDIEDCPGNVTYISEQALSAADLVIIKKQLKTPADWQAKMIESANYYEPEVRKELGINNQRSIYSFKLNGDIWELRFEDETGKFSNLKGFNIIHILMEKPGRKIASYELAEYNSKIVKAEKSNATIVDSDYKKDIVKNMKELEEELEEANRNKDISRQETISIKIEKLKKFARSTQYRGKSKNLGPNVEDKARSSITLAIKRTIEKIEGTNMPKFASHLSQNISTGLFCSYTPHESIQWEL